MIKKAILLTGLLLSSSIAAQIEVPQTADATSFIAYSNPDSYSVNNVRWAYSKVAPGQLYKIRKNDSIENLAKASGVTIKEFAKANDITKVREVPAGKKVIFRQNYIWSKIGKTVTTANKVRIDYKMIEQPLPDVYEGKMKQIVYGHDGEKLVTQTFKYIKGKKKLISTNEKILVEPVDSIIGVGTKKRYVTEQRSEQMVVPFQKKTIEDATMIEGTTKVIQQGVNGVEENIYTVKFDDLTKQVSEKTLISTKIIQSAVDEVTAVGTKLLENTDNQPQQTNIE